MLLPIRSLIDRRAAIYAGIAAGIIATVTQIILWQVFQDVLPWILYRDARLAAAILLGRDVLPPPMTFDWAVICAATLVHFALSIAYSIILAHFISRYRLLYSLFVGTCFGLVLYGINMYVFTIIFPWFSEARDWITIVTHAVFGISCAGAYKKLSAR